MAEEEEDGELYDMSPVEHAHRHFNDNPDSLSVGTDGKGGNIKVYGNFLNMDEFRKKIDNALILRSETQRKMEQ